MPGYGPPLCKFMQVLWHMCVLRDTYLHLQMQGMTAEDFRSFMAVDKKVLDGKLRLILLRGPLGSCVVTGDFDPAVLDQTLQALCH